MTVSPLSKPARLGRHPRIAALALVVAITAAACGDDPDKSADTAPETTAAPTSTSPPTEPETDSFPVDVTVGDVTVTLAEQPQAIVSLSPTATEMLFAIDAGDQVVAVDQYSYFPEEAPVTDLDGSSPNVEAVLGYEPDLVIVSFDPGDVVAGLETADVPTLVLPAATTLDDTYTQIDALGLATGHTTAASELTEQMRSDIDELVASIPERTKPLRYYHELDDTLFSVTSSTFVGQLYTLAGLENIADPADADGAAGGYPQLSAEFLVDANPDVIFLADTKCCGQSAVTVAERPGWADLSAVQTGNIVELDDDIASRWGPRVVDFLRVIIEATAEIDAA